MRRLLALAVLLLPASLYAQGIGTPPYRGVNRWNLIFPSDNTYDIGAVGATRPRTGYFGTSVVTPALTVSGLTSTRVPVAGVGGLLGDFSTFTFNSGTGTVSATNFAASSGVTAASVTDSGLTSGRITQAGTAGLLQDDADLTFSGTRTTATDLTVTNFPTFSAGTSTRVPIFGASGVVTDDADLTFTGGNTLVATNATVSTLLTIPAGTTAATAVLLANDTDTFIGSVAQGNISFYTNNVERFRMGSGGVFSTTGGVNLGASTASPDAGLFRTAAGVVAMQNGTSVRYLMGGGANVTSATALPVPAAGLYHVTGTTTITSITSTNIGAGTCITLIFDGALTFTNGSNLVIGTDFVTTANDTWHGCYDGTSWFELSRKAN